MKKKFIALFAACSMLATASIGLVQTAYAAGPNVNIVVSDGATETQKVLTFSFEGVDSLMSIQAYFDFFDGEDNDLVESGAVTVDSLEFTAGAQYKDADPDTRAFYATESRKNRSITAEDGTLATATITISEDIDVRLDCVIEAFVDGEGTDYYESIGTVSVDIPKKAAAITPAAVTAVEKQDSVAGTEEYKAQTADIYGVEITPNDESVTGAKVAFGEKTGTLNFGTVYSGQGTVVFAVILASESGDALPTLAADNVTPITAEVE